MTLPQASAEHYREQQRLNLLTLAAARRSWAAMTPDFDSSWRAVGARLVVILTAAQLGSARQGAAYVPIVLAEQGLDAPAVGQPAPGAFAGIASDGRPLDTLLLGAVTSAKQAVSQGLPAREALIRGGRFVDMVFQTQVADAAREAAGVSIAARTGVGWVRMVNPPCCSRCAILAGRFYRWSDGFQRHPHCDCRHIPATEDVAGDLTTDAQALLRSGQITDLTEPERKALDAGSDLAQVVNARRGRRMSGETETATRMVDVRKPDGSVVREERVVNVKRQQVVDGMTTTEGATRRRGQPARLTPAGIYRQAGGDQDAARRLLAENGYLAV